MHNNLNASFNFKKTLHWAGSALAMVGIIFVAIRLCEYSARFDPGRISAKAWCIISLFIAVYAAINLMLAFAWHNFLIHLKVATSKGWALRTYGISQLAKYVPGNVFHLAGRQTLGMAANISGTALAKSSVWELGLISFTGALFGILALPLYSASLSVVASVALFSLVFLIVLSLGYRLIGASVASAFVCYSGFLSISGAIFLGLLTLFSEQLVNANLFLPVCGAYVVAWLAGLVTPGAPAGIGVRELVLLFLMKGLVTESDLLLAILIGRFVTTAGDIFFFIVALLVPKKTKAIK